MKTTDTEVQTGIAQDIPSQIDHPQVGRFRTKHSRTYHSRTDRWVKPFFKQYRGALILAILLGVLTFIFASALMFTSGYLISKAAEAPGNIMVIFLPVAFVRIFGVGKPILHYLERLKSHDWVLRMTSSLRLKLYEALETEAVFFKERYKTGDILGLLAEDIGHLQNLYLRSIFPTIVAWLLYVILALCFGFFSWGFALVMVLLLGIVVIVAPLVSVLIYGARQARRKALKNELYTDLADNVLGVADWVISQRGQDYLDNYKNAERELQSLDASLNRSIRNRDFVLHIVFGLILVAILMWAGSTFGGSYAGNANWIAAFALGFFPLIDAFAPLSQAATETENYRVSIERLNKLPNPSKDSSPDVDASSAESTNDKEVIRHYSAINKDISSMQSETKTATDSEKTRSSASFTIEMKNLAFRYPGSSRKVLDGISLKVESGEKVAILGRSGSGKSTLAALIRGDLSPTEGSMLINGAPSSSYGDHIPSLISVIQQQTYLFNMTLADNLRIGNPAATETMMWHVLERVGLKEMVERLPDTLETMVDEAGLRFSGGERHRIALARVLLKDTPIVVLDEPTVGLDPITEQELLRTLFETLSEKTIIMITHHLQGVSLMDRVIFIEEGHLRLNDSPDNLKNENTFYQQLLEFDKGIDLF